MNRLTGKPENNKTNYKVRKKEQEWNDAIQNAINKLGKLEDLEEELGCPLEVVIKALKDGIIVSDEGLINTAYSDEKYNQKYKTNEYDDLTLYFGGDEFYLNDLTSPYGDLECGEYGCSVKLKDYQKTWWLKGEKNE